MVGRDTQRTQPEEEGRGWMGLMEMAGRIDDVVETMPRGLPAGRDLRLDRRCKVKRFLASAEDWLALVLRSG